MRASNQLRARGRLTDAWPYGRRTGETSACWRRFARSEGRACFELQQGFARTLARRSDSSLLLVGTVGDEVAGYGLAKLFEPPAGSPAKCAPAGWYLLGLGVRPERRRLGLGAELTRARLEWLSRRTDYVYYFANSANLASIALHASFGFGEVSRDFWYPEVSFAGGEGVLFGADLRQLSRL